MSTLTHYARATAIYFAVFVFGVFILIFGTPKSLQKLSDEVSQ